MSSSSWDRSPRPNPYAAADNREWAYRARLKKRLRAQRRLKNRRAWSAPTAPTGTVRPVEQRSDPDPPLPPRPDSSGPGGPGEAPAHRARV